MRILLTGASSFTGCWIARKLSEACHDVVATFTRPSFEAYTEQLSAERIDFIRDHVTPLFECAFGSDQMLQYLRSYPVDLIFMHAAQVGNHRASDFSVLGAVESNTRRLDTVLDLAKEHGLKGVVSTGTYFEADTGTGSDSRAFSPYALSKGLTWQIVRYACEARHLKVGKFVLANPFGPMEKGGFTSYLVRCWAEGEVPRVQTPEYGRDNVPVDLLAQAAVRFCEDTFEGSSNYQYLEASAYRMKQGAFARRFADKIQPYLPVDCDLFLNEQRDFSEPIERYNRNDLSKLYSEWDEDSFWRTLGEWYKRTFFSRTTK